MKLETTNPNYFAYKTEELLIELLGGVRIDRLDRMRVTIKVTVVNRKHSGYLTNHELAVKAPPNSYHLKLKISIQLTSPIFQSHSHIFAETLIPSCPHPFITEVQD